MHSLKFDYTRIGDHYFPLIDVELISPKNSVITKAYVDSGATYSIYKREIADILDIDFKKGQKMYPFGIGGHICAYLHLIKIRVETTEFECDVLFSEELLIKFNIVGRKGFFDRFKVCFDDKQKMIELVKR